MSFRLIAPVAAIMLSAASGLAAEAPTDPEGGSVKGGAYVDPYFGLTYPLPPGWSEGLKGPPPSSTGYYVLSALDGSGDGKPSLLIVAQDMFFGAKPLSGARDMARELREAEARKPMMHIDREPQVVEIAKRRFLRLDYSAGGLYRAWLGIDIRCHVVAFNFTATTAAALAVAVASLEKLSLPAEASAETPGSPAAGSSLPACIKDYASGANVFKRVEPAPAGPRFLAIPVRIIIGTDGRVKHIHVISAFAEQKTAIETALRQWRFKPYVAEGRPSAVETGLVFEFKPAAAQ